MELINGYWKYLTANHLINADLGEKLARPVIKKLSERIYNELDNYICNILFDWDRSIGLAHQER